MKLRSCTAMLFATVAVLTAANAHAQALLADKKDITGFAARKMIEACIAEAARDRYPIAIAVVDSAGYLLSYQATDGATGNTGETAQLKAKTAAKFRSATAELYERVNKQINRAPEWMGYFPIPGGFPVEVQGEIVGAIGVGAAGLSGGKDEDCAAERDQGRVRRRQVVAAGEPTAAARDAEDHHRPPPRAGSSMRACLCRSEEVHQRSAFRSSIRTERFCRSKGTEGANYARCSRPPS